LGDRGGGGWGGGGVVRAARCAGALAAVIAWEVVFMWQSVPAGLDAWRQRRAAKDEFGGLSEDVRYGDEEAQVLDYYRGSLEGTCRRLVVYVHGGAWGSGAKWHYAGLARRVRRESGGAVGVAVVQYGLHKKCGDVATMTRDVDAAVKWAVREAGGDLEGAEVVLAGQSSGAHLCALWAVQRALASKAPSEVGAMVLVSGVFDCWEHYWHERKRGVHLLSPMLPAMGGRVDAEVPPGRWAEELFMKPLAAHSPTRILLGEARQGRDLSKHLPKRVHLLHGDADTTVPVAQSVDFASALSRAGMGHAVRFDVLQGAGHAQLLLDLMGGRGSDQRKTGRQQVDSPGRDMHARRVSAALGGSLLDAPTTAD